MIIHIGLDTVKLGGKHFNTHVKQGDRITVGKLLVDFDMNKIKEEGFDTITPVIITNSADFSEVLAIDDKAVKAGEEIIKVVK